MRDNGKQVIGFKGVSLDFKHVSQFVYISSKTSEEWPFQYPASCNVLSLSKGG